MYGRSCRKRLEALTRQQKAARHITHSTVAARARTRTWPVNGLLQNAVQWPIGSPLGGTRELR